MTTLKNVTEPATHLVDPDAVPETPGVAALIAVDLAVATPRGRVFGDVTTTLSPGCEAAVVGGARTGKSTLLLALTGRMRHVSGSLLVAGHDGIAHPRQVRAVTAVARVANVIAPEPTLSLDDCLTERTLFDAASPRTRLANYFHAAHLLGLDAHPDTLYRDLAPIDRTRAALALASVRPSALIVLDDLDLGLTLAEQEDLWRGIAALAADGPAIVAATTEVQTVPATAVRIDLTRN